MPIQSATISFPGPTPTHQVQLPGWNDVIHWRPLSSLPISEQLRIKQEQRFYLLNSPTPGVISDFAKIGQEIDAIQDALVTLSVIGRVTTALTRRAIPGLGWVATGADVLNAWNVFYPPVPGAGRLRHASKEAKRATAEASKAQGGTYKRRLLDTLKTGQIGLGLGEVLQIAQTSDELFGIGLSLGPVFGAITDTLFGAARGATFDFSHYLDGLGYLNPVAAAGAAEAFFGYPLANTLTLGAVGAIGSTLTMTGLTPQDVANKFDAYSKLKISWPGIIPLFDLATGAKPGTTEAQIAAALAPLVGPAQAGIAAVLYAFGASQNAIVSAAVTLGRALGYLGGYRDDLTQDTHDDLTMGATLLLNLIQPAMTALDYPSLARDAINRPWYGGPLPNVPDAPAMSVGQVTEQLRNTGHTAPQRYLPSRPSTQADEFRLALTAQYTDDLILALEGPDARVVEDSGPHWRAALAIQDLDIIPPNDAEPEQTRAYLDRIASFTGPTGSGWPPRQAIEATWSNLWGPRREQP